MPNNLRIVKDGLSDLAKRPPRNLPSLDVLRSLAILLVFSGHFGDEFGASPAVRRFPLLYFGWTGVDLFFVLSGLLIGIQIWKELQKSGSIRIGRFLAETRLSHLAPLFQLCSAHRGRES